MLVLMLARPEPRPEISLLVDYSVGQNTESVLLFVVGEIRPQSPYCLHLELMVVEGLSVELYHSVVSELWLALAEGPYLHHLLFSDQLFVQLFR